MNPWWSHSTHIPLQSRKTDWNQVSSDEDKTEDQYKDFANFSKHKKQYAKGELINYAHLKSVLKYIN